MDNYNFIFHSMNMANISISFTWDDNLLRHNLEIAPLFIQNQFRCTFYINPGDPDFTSDLCSMYMNLASQSFEIGSHSYNHLHLSKLEDDKYYNQLTKSIEELEEIFGIRPTTFAFPHHDYNNKMLEIAKAIFLETRNSLFNSKRFSMKSNTTIEDMISAINEAINSGYNLVFSGHSISLQNDKTEDGYEPLPIENLNGVLIYLNNKKRNVDFLTFEQAALKEYIKQNCSFNSHSCLLDYENLLYLSSRGITYKKILELL